jgi:hypothetical protein
MVLVQQHQRELALVRSMRHGTFGICADEVSRQVPDGRQGIDRCDEIPAVMAG